MVAHKKLLLIIPGVADVAMIRKGLDPIGDLVINYRPLYLQFIDNFIVDFWIILASFDQVLLLFWFWSLSVYQQVFDFNLA